MEAQDKLEYVQKAFKRPNRLAGEVGADKVREAITDIQKTGNTSFFLRLRGWSICKANWQQGRHGYLNWNKKVAQGGLMKV